MKNNSLNRRWLYLVLGVTSMLFAGIIYGWSILKTPFSLYWTAPQLALNFTITMTCFCLGGFLGAKLSNRLGVRNTLLISGALAFVGFLRTSSLSGNTLLLLYLSYGVLAGFGIGIAYNVVISTVNAWFPDKKGLSSGCMMMGFGASSLIIGNAASKLMDAWGWQRTYMLLGVALGVVLIAAALILKKPDADTILPAPRSHKNTQGQELQPRDYTTGEMLQLKSFWMIFVAYAFIGAVGNSVISFARDLAISVGAPHSLATMFVGLLSMCNGLGRVIAGALFDAVGRRKTMLASGLITIAAASVSLVAVLMGSLRVCVVGLCLVGMSYGFSPTVSSTAVASFYGQKHFPTNFSILNLGLIGASFMATACSSLYTATNSYVAPFIVLVALSCAAMSLIVVIKKA